MSSGRTISGCHGLASMDVDARDIDRYLHDLAGPDDAILREMELIAAQRIAIRGHVVFRRSVTRSAGDSEFSDVRVDGLELAGQVRDGVLVESSILTPQGAKQLSMGEMERHSVHPLSFKALVLEIWSRGIHETSQQRQAA